MLENPGPSRAEIEEELAKFNTKKKQKEGLSKWLDKDDKGKEKIRNESVKDLILSDLSSYREYLKGS